MYKLSKTIIHFSLVLRERGEKHQIFRTQVILLPWMETYFYNQDLGHLRKRDLGLLRNLRKRDLALLRKDWRGLLAMRARP